MRSPLAASAAGLIFAAGAWLLVSCPPARPQSPEIEATAAILVDGATGEVLFQKAMHERRPMASTTKIMTALLVVESAKLDALVTVSERASRVSGSSLHLRAGERIPMDDLLAGLLVGSANDAAVAIAEHIGGTVAGFVSGMNQRAQRLGAHDTHFVNPHGLHDPDHYSSAYDLALIAREAMRYPRFRQLVAAKEVTITRQGRDGPLRITSHNRLLWRSDSVDGVKTGYVRQSGHCLVASATNDGWQLIAVLLDSPDMYGEALTLLDYGFSSHRRTIHARAGDALGRACVRQGEANSVRAICRHTLVSVNPLARRESSRVEVTLGTLQAPVACGDPVGEARLLVGGRVVARSPLLAAEAVGRSRFLVVGGWALRFTFFLALAALMVKTHAKVVKANRRGRRCLPTEGGRPDSRRARIG